jgi:hypothetical protein
MRYEYGYYFIILIAMFSFKPLTLIWLLVFSVMCWGIWGYYKKKQEQDY